MYRFALLGLFLLLMFTGLVAPAWAHDYWLKPDGARAATLQYGHGNESDAYDAKVVKSVGGWTADGAKKVVEKTFAKGQMKLTGSGVGIWAAEIDNGYWTKTIEGWKNVGKRQQPNALKATYDKHFAKLVNAKGAGKAVGQQLEIVLTSVSADKVEGKVLRDGKPAANVKLEKGHDKVGQTDATGKFSVKPGGAGLFTLSAHIQEKLEGNPDADFLNLDATITIKI